MTMVRPSGARRTSLKRRLYATHAAHRMFPMALGYRYARVRTERWWSHDAQARADARLQMKFLVGRCFEGDLDALAKDYMFESLKREELGWRPWLMMRFPVDGIERLRAAHAEGKGVLLSLLHHGQYHGIFSSLARYGIQVQVVAAPWFLRKHAPEDAGRLSGRISEAVSRYGTQLLDATGSYARIREMLVAGEIVAIASDVPGTTEATFLGRRVAVRSGAARLAIDVGAPIVPIVSRRDGWTQRLQILEPFAPGPDSDHRAVLTDILARHEPAVGAWPAAFHWPLRRFGFVDPEDIAEFGFERDEYFRRFRI
jgi:lauroyl/myristoyl acyltransferase